MAVLILAGEKNSSESFFCFDLVAMKRFFFGLSGSVHQSNLHDALPCGSHRGGAWPNL
jgi:hypothetical protein